MNSIKKGENSVKVFCFSYAGGNAAFFDKIKEELHCVADVIPIEYAGHGSRRKEPFYNNMKTLAEDMYNVLKYLTKEDYALFGYSMGSITAVEVLNIIIKRKEIALPKYMFLAAHEPKTKYELNNYIEDENDEYIKQRTISFGGIPEKLINNSSFWRVYLPIYRADYSIIGKYNFEKLDLTTEIPALIFYSEKDTHLEDMKKWKKYFIGVCEFSEYEGTHFFMNEHYKDIAEEMKKKMEVYV